MQGSESGWVILNMRRNTKKYSIDGLIQFTLFLSLIGVRVDIDSYLNGRFNSLLVEIDGGSSSAFIQTPLHHYRDTEAGFHLHHKCPELEYELTSRQLLSEVRALGSPARFPTRLSAWLVHLVPNEAAPQPPPSTGTSTAAQQQSDNTDSHNDADSLHEVTLNQTRQEIVKDEEEIDSDSPNHLPESATLEQERLELHGHWPDFLSELDDFESLVSQHMTDLDVVLQNPVSYNASLQDATVGNGGGYRPDPPGGGGQAIPQQRASLFSMESTNCSRSNRHSGALSLFSSLGNSSQNGTSHSRVGGFLDEAVFDQINLLGLEGLASMDSQLLNQMEGNSDSPCLEELESDSGLSLESSSKSSTSSSSSDSFCDDEVGATGYSSEVESLSNKGGACALTCFRWPTDNLNVNIWHDHTYSTQLPEGQASYSCTSSLKVIKKEVMSDDETEPEELSRDERRLQALGLPFSAPDIVNMPVDDFLELLEGQGLSLSEVNLLRDVRRRGKNKLAAQNCRKRKLHAILGLQAEVAELAAQRDALLRERTRTLKTLSVTAERYEVLSHDLLQQLRDEHGQPLSPELYMLHCSTNGRVVVRPRGRADRITTAGTKSSKRKKDKKP